MGLGCVCVCVRVCVSVRVSARVCVHVYGERVKGVTLSYRVFWHLLKGHCLLV